MKLKQKAFRFLLTLTAILTVSFCLGSPCQAGDELDPKFYAHAEIQALAPGAFATQSTAGAFHMELGPLAKAERDQLIKDISKDEDLMDKVASFESLEWIQKREVIEAIFKIETESLQIAAPELIIDNKIIKGPAYFDFDVNSPGPGRVILNPDALSKMDIPYGALLLLVHETRHSAQFQRAFKDVTDESILNVGFRNAFKAQKELKGRLSFCDFNLLNNEYEAFQFGNYVVGAITSGKAETLQLGSFASQFQFGSESPIIDLAKMFEVEKPELILDLFNELEKDQYMKLHE